MQAATCAKIKKKNTKISNRSTPLEILSFSEILLTKDLFDFRSLKTLASLVSLTILYILLNFANLSRLFRFD